MVEHVMRVASEAAEARIPDLIAEWSRRHPALTRTNDRPVEDGTDSIAPDTRSIATGPRAEP